MAEAAAAGTGAVEMVLTPFWASTATRTVRVPEAAVATSGTPYTRPAARNEALSGGVEASSLPPQPKTTVDTSSAIASVDFNEFSTRILVVGVSRRWTARAC